MTTSAEQVRERIIRAIHGYSLPIRDLTDVADAVMPVVAEILAERDAAIEWVPGRWWRAVGSDGELWCESSYEQEVRREARPGDRIDQWWTTVLKGEWRADGTA
jgi:hypothetical protein